MVFKPNGHNFPITESYSATRRTVKLGMVMHTYDPSTQVKQEDGEFKFSLSYTARPYFQNKTKKTRSTGKGPRQGV
jgi:hypothetical protein